LPLVLASGSPQRRELLARLGVPFTVRVSGAEELEQGPDPAAVALENARRKARAALRPGAAEAVLGCDTIVVLDGTIYGKPADEAAARATITALGGRTHEVISCLALLLGGEQGAEERTALARSRVAFRALDEQLIDWYLATEEWRGRSGGYAIQGATGARLATGVEGEEENVVGLPLRALVELAPELFAGDRGAGGD
jgi:septum formation protein